MKIGKKVQKKLEHRLNGFRQMCKLAERSLGSSKAYRCPGSRNPKKT